MVAEKLALSLHQQMHMAGQWILETCLVSFPQDYCSQDYFPQLRLHLTQRSNLHLNMPETGSRFSNVTSARVCTEMYQLGTMHQAKACATNLLSMLHKSICKVLIVLVQEVLALGWHESHSFAGQCKCRRVT